MREFSLLVFDQRAAKAPSFEQALGIYDQFTVGERARRRRVGHAVCAEIALRLSLIGMSAALEKAVLPPCHEVPTVFSR